MATQNTSVGKTAKPADVKREIPAAKPAQAEPETPVETTVAMDVAEKPAAPKPAPVVVQASAAEDEFIAASFKFDSGEWTKKSFDLWSENTTALLDLAEQITKAKTLDEVVSLQTRFVNGRLDSFLRQSKDAMAFAQSVFNIASTPVFGARAA